MKITFLPKTKLGIWAVIMAIVSFSLFIVGSILPFKVGYTGIEILIQNPIQVLITILVIVIGIGSGIMALIAIIKKREGSLIVFLTVLSGLYSVFSFVGIIINFFI